MSRGTRGLTLVELMVVIAVLAIITTLAAPSLVRLLANQRLQGAARELAADLYLARQEALRYSTAVALVATSAGYSVTRGTVTLKAVDLPPGVTMAATTVRYGGLHAMASNASGTTAAVPLTLSHAIGASIVVTAEPTGRLQICSPGGSHPGYPACTP